ncbi:hypothetical protein PS910_04376 [Pseudomonas fluorescens]|nr:hypothetical protein PS910_04376 [Pseudomonas fluorescens]
MTAADLPVDQDLPLRQAEEIKPFNIIVTLVDCTSQRADLVIGSNSMLDREVTLGIGKSVLIESGINGSLLVRLTRGGYRDVSVRVEKVKPGSRLFGAFEPLDDQTPFTSADREAIKLGLDLVLAEVRNSALVNTAQFAALKEQLDEASEATKRLSRKDWVLYFMGILASITISAGFSSEAVKALMCAVEDSVGKGAVFALRLLSKF